MALVSPATTPADITNPFVRQPDTLGQGIARHLQQGAGTNPYQTHSGGMQALWPKLVEHFPTFPAGHPPPAWPPPGFHVPSWMTSPWGTTTPPPGTPGAPPGPPVQPPGLPAGFPDIQALVDYMRGSTY